MISIIALNTGMRIGDVICLKVTGVINKAHIVLREEKTHKTKVFSINPQLKEAISHYVDGMSDQALLFPSRQKNTQGVKSHITRVQAYRYFKKVAEENAIDNFGMHSLRKSFGYFYYQETKDIAKLMQIFNHSSKK